MAKFSCSHSLSPILQTSLQGLYFWLRSSHININRTITYTQSTYGQKIGTGSDVRGKTSHTSNVIKVKIQCGVHIKGPWNGKTNSVTHQTFETLWPSSWMTKAFAVYTRESKRIPGFQGLRWMVNSSTPSSRPHPYTVIPKKLTRI